MAVYAYTGKLTDFGEAPFPDAIPKLTVVPLRDAFSPSGPAAAKPIVVPVASTGAFSVDLIASIDLIPPTAYSLRCEWLNAGNDPVGWAQWDFTAQPGGGPISTMPGSTLTRVWYATTAPPVNRPGIYWIHPTTGDVRVWS
ncbi:hypothetical protein [Microbacterium sp. AR7-10]|uniref:hypothetical protein n=1 Tax=Microbacterium sp. AR7-10 TaxID=1891970 RepID=UPI0008FCE017|nr:hypothetical protein [Microbacterium sp. AR7-10]OIU88670.1 hypothetical protein BFN01_04295 [Microbacterium sp. AR7-10]